MALKWACGESAPFFEENEIAGLIAHDPEVRGDLVEIFAGHGDVEVFRDETRLTRWQMSDLAYLTGICRRPSAWLMRDSLAANLQWIFTCHSLPFSSALVKEIIAAIAMSGWKNAPTLEERIESISPAYVQALSLARLRLLPHRVIVIESPLAGWTTGERSLLLDTLYVSCEAEALKLIIAARRDDLPSFCDRMVIVERGADGLNFAEVV